MKIDTDLVHYDPAPGDPHRPSAPPLYQTATFVQPTATGFAEYDYTRSGNPTRALLEAQLARLEGGVRAFAFTSGMAALAAVLRSLPTGAHVLAGRNLYGGTARLLRHLRSALDVDSFDPESVDGLRAALRPGTAMVVLETPTNPLLQIADLAAIAAVTHAHGARLLVDNTLMSPYLQRPVDCGADFVVHSATKHLAGHGDVMAGAVIAADDDGAAAIGFAQNAEGAGLSPFDSWLVLRGMKTLAVRLQRQQQSAGRIAAFLRQHAAVQRVRFPGLAGHPGAELHARQARGPGSVLCFETGAPEVSRHVVEATRLFRTTVSFGSTSSSISLPCSMSHASLSTAEQRQQGLRPDLVRISVGLEAVDDLLEDLRQALVTAPRAVR